jgi:predicted ArsR family transcriptional regulator
MQATRKKILEKLNSSPPQTAAELARSLRLTSANIRYHLNQLIGEGLVVIAGRIAAPRRGRPNHLYSTTLQAVEGDLTPFVISLWEELVESKSGRQRSDRLSRLAHRLLEGRGTGETSSHLPQQLKRTVYELNSMGYHSHWEAHADSPRLILEHCPFDRIYESLPQLCEVDACVVEALLGQPVEQIAKRRLIAGRGSSCIFRISKNQ